MLKESKAVNNFVWNSVTDITKKPMANFMYPELWDKNSIIMLNK